MISMQKTSNPWRMTALSLALVMILVVAWLLWTGGWPMGDALSSPAAVGSVTSAGALPESAAGQDAADAATGLPMVQIQSPDVALSATSASGNLALVEERAVPLAVGGIVKTIAVEVGDAVQAGDLLLELDTTDLQRALAQAQLAVESAQIALDDLNEPATAADLAQAEASLAEAEQNLADLLAGPSAAEVAAAQSSLAAAQASYTELLAGPSAAELTQLQADLRKAEIALADAQRAYDQVAWRADASASSAASDLQAATIDYEKVQAAYSEATAAASTSSVQSALSSVSNAQASLESLSESASAAEIEAAEAQVSSAGADLADLQTGPSARDLRSAEISLENALISLESAQRDLDAAVLRAPVSGVVTALNAA
ncbi:MAG: biotin/lipoyl-binding protein, partial [Caldilineaceae bacterium]